MSLCSCWVRLGFYVFFQAEDGIRDVAVTGVQTCALPISGGGDEAMAALFFEFGRYLMISGSRAGGQPLNLQGIWNDKIQPPWASAYTTNINLEMNYWPVETTKLPE